MTQPAEAVTTESTLQNLPILRAIKKRAPLLQLPHTLGSFLGMNLSHAPVVKQLAAAHGVAEMSAPVVGRIHVGHRRRDSTFRHDGVRFAQQRFRNHAHFRTFCQSSQSRTQASTAGADDQHIVVVGFVFCAHRILRSVIVPLATSRT